MIFNTNLFDTIRIMFRFKMVLTTTNLNQSTMCYNIGKVNADSLQFDVFTAPAIYASFHPTTCSTPTLNVSSSFVVT